MRFLFLRSPNLAPQSPQNPVTDLPTKLVHSARQEEIKFMQEWGVGELKSVSEAVQVTGKQPLWGKWVDRNKGDEE